MKRIVCLLLCLCLLCGCEKEVKKETYNVTTNQLFGMYNTLKEYGNIVYESYDYSKYEVEDGLYFISVDDLLNDFDFDMSLFVNEYGAYLDVTRNGFYIDLNHVLDYVYEDDEFVYVVLYE